MWWMSGVVDVLFYTGLADVWCGRCPAWWMSGVVNVLFYTQCGGCPVWWKSGVVDVCVVDVKSGFRMFMWLNNSTTAILSQLCVPLERPHQAIAFLSFTSLFIWVAL